MTAQTKGEQTRLNVIAASFELFNRNGYTNTSMDDITRATGVKKGNLYFHFSSKEDLGVEVLDTARREYFSYLRSSLKSESPSENIKNLLEAVFRFHRKKNFEGGCIFGNIALEMADLSNRLSGVVRGVLDEWVLLMEDLLTAAENKGEIKLFVSPDVTARHIVATIEGGIMMSRLSKKGRELRECIDAVFAMLEIK